MVAPRTRRVIEPGRWLLGSSNDHWTNILNNNPTPYLAKKINEAWRTEAALGSENKCQNGRKARGEKRERRKRFTCADRLKQA